MVVKINSKPIRVVEDEKKIDWIYLSVTVIGYGLILWIMKLAYVTFLGGF